MYDFFFLYHESFVATQDKYVKTNIKYHVNVTKNLCRSACTQGVSIFDKVCLRLYDKK